MDFLLKFKSFLKGEGVIDLKQIMKEKRFFPRMRCAVEVKCLDEQKQFFDAVVVEVSLYGMRLSCAKKLKPGECYSVEAIRGRGIFREDPQGRAPVKMKVVWCKKRPSTHDYLAGLHYEDTRRNLQSSWVARILQRYGVSVGMAVQKRRRVRIPANIPLAISIALETWTGTLIDIGIGGMLIATSDNIHLKEELRFRIGPHGHLEPFFCNGRIVHERFVASQKKWIYGVVFLEMDEKHSHLLSDYLTELTLEQKE